MRLTDLFILLAAGILLWSCQREPSYPRPPLDADRVSIDVAEFQDSVPRFYSLPLGKTTVRFFVVRHGDEIRSYFDACRRCYADNKGYRANPTGLVCRKCDVAYPLEDLAEGLGACHPLPLAGSPEGDHYIIALADLRAGSDLFP